jgi:hypothetical protein
MDTGRVTMTLDSVSVRQVCESVRKVCESVRQVPWGTHIHGRLPVHANADARVLVCAVVSCVSCRIHWTRLLYARQKAMLLPMALSR